MFFVNQQQKSAQQRLDPFAAQAVMGQPAAARTAVRLTAAAAQHAQAALELVRRGGRMVANGAAQIAHCAQAALLSAAEKSTVMLGSALLASGCGGTGGGRGEVLKIGLLVLSGVGLGAMGIFLASPVQAQQVIRQAIRQKLRPFTWERGSWQELGQRLGRADVMVPHTQNRIRMVLGEIRAIQDPDRRIRALEDFVTGFDRAGGLSQVLGRVWQNIVPLHAWVQGSTEPQSWRIAHRLLDVFGNAANERLPTSEHIELMLAAPAGVFQNEDFDSAIASHGVGLDRDLLVPMLVRINRFSCLPPLEIQQILLQDIACKSWDSLAHYINERPAVEVFCLQVADQLDAEPLHPVASLERYQERINVAHALCRVLERNGIPPLLQRTAGEVFDRLVDVRQQQWLAQLDDTADAATVAAVTREWHKIYRGTIFQLPDGRAIAYRADSHRPLFDRCLDILQRCDGEFRFRNRDGSLVADSKTGSAFVGMMSQLGCMIGRKQRDESPVWTDVWSHYHRLAG